MVLAETTDGVNRWFSTGKEILPNHMRYLQHNWVHNRRGNVHAQCAMNVLGVCGVPTENGSMLNRCATLQIGNIDPIGACKMHGVKAAAVTVTDRRACKKF